MVDRKDGKLKITSTSNQDNPLMDVAVEQGEPILALDVWEHAYYISYKTADQSTLMHGGMSSIGMLLAKITP